MALASRLRIEQGDSVILIGTDCVEISATLLQQASLNMLNNDATINCTTDGGYALLGINKFNALLFGSIAWSTDAVASTTLGRIRQLGWSVHVGQMLHDVDEVRDLKYLSGYWMSRVAA